MDTNQTNTDNVGVLGIDFDEITQSSYKGTYVFDKDRIRHDYNTGDIIQDVITAWNFLCDNGCDHILMSSSFDAFLMVGGDYVSDEEQLIKKISK